MRRIVASLFRLARHGHLDEVRALLEEHPDVHPDATDKHLNSLLLLAAQVDNKRLVKMALRRGGSIDWQNEKGMTALHFCFLFGHTNLGDYLISKGANTKLRNLEGQTCFEIHVVASEARRLSLSSTTTAPLAPAFATTATSIASIPAQRLRAGSAVVHPSSHVSPLGVPSSVGVSATAVVPAARLRSGSVAVASRSPPIVANLAEQWSRLKPGDANGSIEQE